MKLSLLFVAILGVATATAVPTRKVLPSTKGLQEDWADFYALIDTDAVVTLVKEYAAEDAEFQEAIEYMHSDEFKALVIAIDQIHDWQVFMDYLETHGLHIRQYFERIKAWVGITSRLATHSTSRLASTRITGGLAGFWADLKALLPLDDLRALWEEKLETSEEFAALVEVLKSDRAKAVYGMLKTNEEYQWIRAELVAAGLDIDYIISWAKELIGWQ